MKTFRSAAGPFREQPYFTEEEIERVCSDALHEQGLFPADPQPVRIERFIEKRFQVHPEPQDLPVGVLGYTLFGPKGVEGIYYSRELHEEGTRVSERRVATTLAHEGGHGLLHAYLFALEAERNLPLFGKDADVTARKILCRDGGKAAPRGQGYDGRWWEVQANKAMAALLLPRPLLVQCLAPFLVERGAFGRAVLDDSRREEAVRLAASTFEVNPVVVRHRLEPLYPLGDRQLTL